MTLGTPRGFLRRIVSAVPGFDKSGAAGRRPTVSVGKKDHASGVNDARRDDSAIGRRQIGRMIDIPRQGVVGDDRDLGVARAQQIPGTAIAVEGRGA